MEGERPTLNLKQKLELLLVFKSKSLTVQKKKFSKKKAEFHKKDKTCINFEPSFKLRWCHARDLMDHLPYHIETIPLI